MGDDIRDILGEELVGIARAKENTVEHILKPPKRTRAAPPSQKKPTKRRKTGLEREIAALQASNQPTQAPVEHPKGFELKEKRKLSSAPAERWIFRGFINTARNDNFKVFRWGKAINSDEGLTFANFTQKVPIMEYTDAQYDGYFRSLEWSKEETDYLLSMCKQYDLRFIVIADRWSMVPRTIEDIKERFYSIQKKLIEVASSSKTDTLWRENPLISDPYNKEQEINRKKQLEILCQKNSIRPEEEEELLQSAGAITQAFTKHEKETKKILKLASKAIKVGDGRQSRGRGRGRRGGRGDGNGGSHSKAEALRAFSFGTSAQKYQKYNQQITDALATLGISKPPSSNSRLAGKYNGLRSALIVLFELQRLEAEGLYQLQVLLEQKKLLAPDNADDQNYVHGQIFSPSTNGTQDGLDIFGSSSRSVNKDFGLQDEEEKDSDEDDDPYAEEDDDGDGDDDDAEV